MTFESNGIYSIRGIVSKGVPKDCQINVCDTREYIIFTDVVHYIDWIKEVVPELNGTSSANIPGVVLISIFEIDQRARRLRTLITLKPFNMRDPYSLETSCPQFMYF